MLSEVVVSSSEVVVEDVLSVDADEPPSSLLAQEMMMRLIIGKKIMSICLIGFLIGYFRKTLHIPKLGRFYKNEGGGCGGCLTVKKFIKIV